MAFLCTIRALPISTFHLPLPASVEIHPADRRSRSVLNSLLVADSRKQVVDVRQMAGGHIFDEDAHDFVVAHAPVNPAQEQDELHEGGDRKCGPMRIDKVSDHFECLQNFHRVPAISNGSELLPIRRTSRRRSVTRLSRTTMQCCSPRRTTRSGPP